MEHAETRARELVDWFAAHARDLPWRQGYAPYAVWVSEIMAQQTRMDQLIPYFLRWMEALPDVRALAQVEEARLLKLWEGLGYYNRARNLKKAAQEILERGGELPQDRAALEALPGIGPYTAGAIASIAFDQPEPLIDGNIERVLSRLLDLEENPKTAHGKRLFLAQVAQLMAHQSPRQVAQGLMELGALVCSPKAPDCGACPWGPACRARKRGTQVQRPVLPPRPASVAEKRLVLVFEQGGDYYLERQPLGGRWGGLDSFIMPLVKAWPAAEGLEAFYPLGAEPQGAPEYLGEIAYSITKYRVKARVWVVSLKFRPQWPGHWAGPSKLWELALPRPGVKARELL